MTDHPVLHIEGVNKIIDGKTILKDIHLKVARGNHRPAWSERIRKNDAHQADHRVNQNEQRLDHH